MKKFLVYLLIVLGAVAIGFGTYMLVENREIFTLLETSKYVTVGEEFEISFDWERPKSDLVISSTNESVVTYNESTKMFKANAGGIAHVTFRLEGSTTARNNAVQIFVGDGTLFTPFYIKNAEQLARIGDTSIPNNIFTLEKAYKLINDVDVKEYPAAKYWLPIGVGSDFGFVGNFDGNGYAIKNILINPVAYQTEHQDFANFNKVGLFDRVGINGRVVNLKIDNFKVTGEVFDAVGTIAGENRGTIERVEVRSTTLDVVKAEAIGGIVGRNLTSDDHPDDDAKYVRNTARLDRVSANVLIGADIVTIDQDGESYSQYVINGTGGTVGGLVGENIGGIVIYSYARGSVFLNSLTTYYGGLIGNNSYFAFRSNGGGQYIYDNGGAHVKDSYSNVKLYTKLALPTNPSEEPTVVIGGLIGINTDVSISPDLPDTITNRLIGNYYNREYLNAFEMGEEEPLIKTYGLGIGKYIKNDLEKEFLNTDFAVMEVTTTDELKEVSTFRSHVQVEVSYDANGNRSTRDKIIPWKFDSVWQISANINEGFPYLNYANIELTDDIYTVSDEKTISSIDELKAMKVDGHYTLIADIDLGQDWFEANRPSEEWAPWTPIGTTTRAFSGSFRAESYVKDGKRVTYEIRNLTVNGETDFQSTYGGFFGVLTNENSGVIKDLVFVNASVINYKYSGVVAGSNGYEYTDMQTKKPQTKQGLTISNIQIRGANVEAFASAGAITGANYGTIKGAVVDDVYGANNSSIKNSTITVLPEFSGAVVGGIAGKNHSNISRSFVQGSTKVFARHFNEEEPTPTTINAGGITGYNYGTIEESSVFEAAVDSTAGISGGFGGIAGTNVGKISAVVVKVSVAADATSISVYVGGAVGILTSQGTIKNVLIENSALDGYYVGGLIGEFSFRKDGHQAVYTFESNGNITSSGNIIAVQYVGVDNVAINGAIAGGLVARMTNGIISDAYAITTLTGVNNNSVKAGIVVELPYYQDEVTTIAGVIQKVYNVTTFGANGTNWAISASEYLKEPGIDVFFGRIPLPGKRLAGYVVNYLYDDAVDGNAKTKSSDNFINDVLNSWFKYEKYSPSTTAQMQSSSKFLDFSFSSANWLFETDKYPKLKALVNLKTNIQNNKVSWTFIPGKVEITPLYHTFEEKDYVTYKENIATVLNGEDFEFTITVHDENIDVSSIVIKVGDVILFPDEFGVYSVSGVYAHTAINISWDLI